MRIFWALRRFSEFLKLCEPTPESHNHRQFSNFQSSSVSAKNSLDFRDRPRFVRTSTTTSTLSPTSEKPPMPFGEPSSFIFELSSKRKKKMMRQHSIQSFCCPGCHKYDSPWVDDWHGKNVRSPDTLRAVRWKSPQCGRKVSRAPRKGEVNKEVRPETRRPRYIPECCVVGLTGCETLVLWWSVALVVIRQKLPCLEVLYPGFSSERQSGSPDSTVTLFRREVGYHSVDCSHKVHISFVFLLLETMLIKNQNPNAHFLYWCTGKFFENASLPHNNYNHLLLSKCLFYLFLSIHSALRADVPSNDKRAVSWSPDPLDSLLFFVATSSCLLVFTTSPWVSRKNQRCERTAHSRMHSRAVYSTLQTLPFTSGSRE